MTPLDTFPHLDPGAAALLALGTAERIAAVQTPQCFDYSAAQTLLSQLGRLARQPRSNPRTDVTKQRLDGLLLLAHTNAGKTSLLGRFLDEHPWDANPDGEAISMPVVFAEVPSRPTEVKLFNAILRALHAPTRASERSPSRYDQVLDLLIGVGARMLILDEGQHLGSVSTPQARHLLDLLKNLSTQAQLNLVLVGVPELAPVVGAHDQLANRLKPWRLPRWTQTREFHELLLGFERALPLRRPSGLATDVALGATLLRLSEGFLGELADLLELAAIHAIEDGSEAISAALIGRLERSGAWTLPARRTDADAADRWEGASVA